MQPWAPSASLATLKARAAIIAAVRAFFNDRGLLEVETPVLSAGGVTDPHIESFRCQWHGPSPGLKLLHTSPEFPMKRLLAAGSGDIWQIARVFRDGEAGVRHNPEFSLLEWYRVGWDHYRLMDEVEALVRSVLPDLGEVARLSYAEAFERAGAPDPHAGTAEAWRVYLRARAVDVPAINELDFSALRDLVLTHCVESMLPSACFLYDYPADQAALARLRPTTADGPPVAERFELYIDGLELANGFHELTDGAEQGARFAHENARRRAMGLDPVPVDERLLAALRAGLPDCAGVALGIDRLVMLALGLRDIRQVLAFSIESA